MYSVFILYLNSGNGFDGNFYLSAERVKFFGSFISQKRKLLIHLVCIKVVAFIKQKFRSGFIKSKTEIPYMTFIIILAESDCVYSCVT